MFSSAQIKNCTYLCYLLLIFFLIAPVSVHAETRGLSIVAKDQTTGQPDGEIKLYNKAWAVFIGIDRYQDLGIPRLKNAVNDARGVKRVLEQRYKFDDYFELYDDKATQKNILELFQDELSDKVSEDDAVFVFWAGHGTQQENSRFGEIGELIPYDGSWKKHSRNISMETLKTNISKSLKARHVFYVMDACYGGLMADKRAIYQQTLRNLKALQQIAKEDVRQVLTAGSKGEQVLDGVNGHSVFTYRLIEALETAEDFITANEIQAVITRNVTSDALKFDHKQTPQYGKLYGQGDFIFVPAKEYQPAEKQAEVERIRKQVEITRQDNDRLKKQMADDEAMLAVALKDRDEAKRQTAELELKRKQGLLKLKEVKQKEREEQLRQAEQESSESAQRGTDRYNSGNPVIAIETSLGSVKIELFADKAPLSVKNFLEYAKSGFYSGTIFHRVIPGFMAQGGGLTAELQPKPGDRPPIRNEAGNGLKNDRGTLAIARTGVVDSATSQFFINIVNNDFLNHRDESPGGFGYAVFGKVIEGMDVVDRMAAAPQKRQNSVFQNVPVTPIEIKSVKTIQ